MSYNAITMERHGNVGILTLYRPEKLNALNQELMKELPEGVEEWNHDPSVGAIVITGAGRAFCAGADLSRLPLGDAAQDTTIRPRQPGALENWVQLVRASKPIVCAINGDAIGAGLTLTLSCDARIASRDVRFSARFVRVAIVPELGSSQILPQIVGLGTAVDLCLSGRNFNADEALRIGLILKVVESSALLAAAVALAGEYADNPPITLREVKSVIYANCVEAEIRSVRQRELDAVARLRGSAEQREAIRAFMERRRPNFRQVADGSAAGG